MAIDPAGVKMNAVATGSVRAHWKFFMGEGVVLLILGMAAIILPQIAAIAVEILIGWLLLMSGIVGLWSSFATRHAPGFGWSLLSAAAGIVAGIILLVWPLSGVVTLTLVLSAFLCVEGVVSIFYAFELDSRSVDTVRPAGLGRLGDRRARRDQSCHGRHCTHRHGITRA
jgi:uncharacterized membrane protein HdeD (DUF308 family)